jgi:hypothetical protein
MLNNYFDDLIKNIKIMLPNFTTRIKKNPEFKVASLTFGENSNNIIEIAHDKEIINTIKIVDNEINIKKDQIKRDVFKINSTNPNIALKILLDKQKESDAMQKETLHKQEETLHKQEETLHKQEEIINAQQEKIHKQDETLQTQANIINSQVKKKIILPSTQSTEPKLKLITEPKLKLITEPKLKLITEPIIEPLKKPLVPILENYTGIWEELPSELYIIGDIHGDFYALKQALQLTNCVIFDEIIQKDIINKYANEIVLKDGCDYYNNTRVRWNPNKTNCFIVFAGDLIDRCRNLNGNMCQFVVQDEDCDVNILKLLLKLNEEAKQYNSKIIIVLGNHEIMNITQNVSYTSKKAHANLNRLDNFQKLIKENIYNLYGIVRIEKYIICHGGINPDFIEEYQENFNKEKEFIEEYNIHVRNFLKDPNYILNDLITEKNSPFWDRTNGRATLSDLDCNKIFENNILNVKNNITNIKIVVAHCPQIINTPEMGINNTYCGNQKNKLWRIDVAMSRAFDNYVDISIINKLISEAYDKLISEAYDKLVTDPLRPDPLRTEAYDKLVTDLLRPDPLRTEAYDKLVTDPLRTEAYDKLVTDPLRTDRIDNLDFILKFTINRNSDYNAVQILKIIQSQETIIKGEKSILFFYKDVFKTNYNLLFLYLLQDVLVNYINLLDTIIIDKILEIKKILSKKIIL